MVMGAMQGRFEVPLPTTGPRACVVCAKLLDWRTALTPRKAVAGSSPALYAVCGTFDCRMVFEQGEHLSDADFGQHLRWRAQVAREEKIRARVRQGRIDAENHEAAAVFDALDARGGRAAKADLRLTVPSGHARLRALPERRRRKHAAHLDAVIAAALDADEPPVQTAPVREPAPDQDLAWRLCGVCGGGCCVGGGEKAYLTPATIARVMAAHPGLDPAELRATYLSYLPERAIPGSCVHHADGGCSLPRSLRSDVCNTFACAPLKLLQHSLEADPPVRTVVVLRRRQSHWNQTNPALNNDIVGAAVLTEGKTTRLRSPNSGGRMAAKGQ